MRKIAISDLHGCLKTFQALIEKQVVLTPQDELYLLGDYVDRGPDSKGVLDYMMRLIEGGYKVHCLKGNHEDMMVQAARDHNEAAMWLYNGGQETLSSFTADAPNQIPEKYLKFVDEFDYFYEIDEFILVHAGLNFVGNQSKGNGEPFLWHMFNPLQDLKAMLWLRWWYDDINWSWLKDRIVIHGHTPVETEVIWDMYEVLGEDQVLDIDNGCFAKYDPGMGKLCAFDMTHRELYFQENIE